MDKHDYVYKYMKDTPPQKPVQTPRPPRFSYDMQVSDDEEEVEVALTPSRAPQKPE